MGSWDIGYRNKLGKEDAEVVIMFVSFLSGRIFNGYWTPKFLHCGPTTGDISSASWTCKSYLQNHLSRACYES